MSLAIPERAVRFILRIIKTNILPHDRVIKANATKEVPDRQRETGANHLIVAAMSIDQDTIVARETKIGATDHLDQDLSTLTNQLTMMMQIKVRTNSLSEALKAI